MDLKSQKNLLLMPLLRAYHDTADDHNEHKSVGETSSTTSFDGFSSDTVFDGSIVGSPHHSVQWDGDESNASVSMYSSPLPWLDVSREVPEGMADYFLPKVINCKGTPGWDEKKKAHSDHKEFAEAEMIKERFAKLLLGEDLSGGGKGVSTALAVSNAITNLSASVFGELWQLEPLSKERRMRWQSEMGRLLSVSDYIVEFVPSSKSLADGTTMKVMDTKPRLDLHISLPALQKLDAMLIVSTSNSFAFITASTRPLLIEALDSFSSTEFWYIDQAMGKIENEGNLLQRQEDRWWLPTPKVPPKGISADARKHLWHQRECINQILKAALAVNAQVLSEMKVPLVYIDSLPKNGRSSLGEALYRAISSEHFLPAALVCSIDPTHEHSIVDLVNSVEAALHIWKRKLQAKQAQVEFKDGQVSMALRGFPNKDGLVGLEKRQVLMERAESLLLLLRLKFPGLPQSILDVNKIQYSKDVGQSILESYSRVLESLAYNIRSRIDDVIHVDDVAKCDQHSTLLRSPSKNGRNATSSVSPFHACGVASPGRPLQSKTFTGGSIKANAVEANQDCEFPSKTIPWLGSYKHWPYSGKVNGLQRSPSGH